MINVNNTTIRHDVIRHDGKNPMIHAGNSGLRLDGWNNLFTGMGVASKDKNTATKFSKSSKLDEITLTFMYRFDGLAKRVINLPANEMVRMWFKVEGDPDSKIIDSLQEIHTKKITKKLLYWARLFGGSLGVLGIDDGVGDLEKPVNMNRVKGLHFITPFDRHRVEWTTDDTYADPSHPKFGQPEIYTIYPINAAIPSFRVHETRTIRFDGEEIPDRSLHENNQWYDSVLQSVHDRLRSMGNIYGGVENIINEFVISTLQMDGLQDLIANGQEDLVQKRLNLIDMSKHILNTVLLDSEEKFEKKSSTTTGLDKIIDKFIHGLSSVTGIPVVLLMGQSPAGLSATGDSDIRFWYDNVASMQDDDLLSQMNYLVDLCAIGLNINPDDVRVKFNPLWQPTEKETAETRKLTAETDEIYISNSVLTPEEIALSRFGGETYSSETQLLTEDRMSLLPENEPEEEIDEEPEEEPGEE